MIAPYRLAAMSFGSKIAAGSMFDGSRNVNRFQAVARGQIRAAGVAALFLGHRDYLARTRDAANHYKNFT
jgi:hypothetical protein